MNATIQDRQQTVQPPRLYACPNCGYHRTAQAGEPCGWCRVSTPVPQDASDFFESAAPVPSGWPR